MNWFYKDSKGTRGPLTETQIRDLLKRADSTAEVRQGNSNWMAATTVQSRFEKLELDGIYLRSNGRTLGPFTHEKADELQASNRERFDARKTGKIGLWASCDQVDQSKTVESPRTTVQPPPLPIRKPNLTPPLQADNYPTPHPPLMAEIVDESRRVNGESLDSIPHWTIPTLADFQRDSLATADSILRRCEIIQKLSHSTSTDFQLLANSLKRFHAACSVAEKYNSQRIQVFQRKAIDEARLNRDEGDTDVLSRQLALAIQAKDQASIESVKQKIEADTAELNSRIESKRKELEKQQLESKVMAHIQSIVLEIAEQVRQRADAVAEERRHEIEEANRHAGKDAFAGLRNPKADSFESWYKRYFNLSRQPLLLSIAIQVPLWCCGGFLVIPCLYLYGKMFSCPACGLLFARKENRREVLAANEGVETVRQRDRHFAQDGSRIGYTVRKEQILMQRQLVRIHYSCKSCRHQWCESQIERYQK